MKLRKLVTEPVNGGVHLHVAVAVNVHDHVADQVNVNELSGGS